jgi:hypothetical protein
MLVRKNFYETEKNGDVGVSGRRMSNFISEKLDLKAWTGLKSGNENSSRIKGGGFPAR